MGRIPVSFLTLWLFFHVASSAFADPHQWPLIPEASELNPPSSKNTRALLNDLERNGRLDPFDEIKVISHYSVPNLNQTMRSGKREE